jgi:hypothetical protein
MFDKEIFKSDLFHFLNDSLKICRDNSDKLKIKKIHEPIFFPNGKYKKSIVVDKGDFVFLIKGLLKNDIKNLKSYDVITNFFVSNKFKKFNKKFYDNPDDEIKNIPNYTNEFPLNFLIEYLNYDRDFIMNKTSFHKCFTKFFKFLEKILVDEYVTPLFNFTSDIGEKGIQIGDIEIRKINQDEFYRFSKLDTVAEISHIYHDITHVMSMSHESDDLHSGYDYVKEQFQILVDSLSLFSIGSPQFGTIYKNINSPWIHHDDKFENNITHQPVLQFNKKDKSKFIFIFNTIKFADYTIKGNSFVKISKNRFISALSRPSQLDKLIDLAISMESLYVSGPGDITLKLVNRSSTLLAKNDKEREDYWSFMKKAYSLRSGIVHGEELRNTEINGKNYTVDEIIKKLIILTQKSIVIYSELINHYDGKNKIEKIYEDIDLALINKLFLKKFHSKYKKYIYN